MTKEEQEELLSEFTTRLVNRDATYDLDGSHMLTIKLADKTWRKKTMVSMTFLPHSIYVSKTDVIFCFTPEDPQPDFETIEVPAAKIDQTFPLLLDDMKAWAQQRFYTGPPGATRVNDVERTSTVKDLLQRIFAYAKEDESLALAADDSEMTSLPNFGMF